MLPLSSDPYLHLRIRRSTLSAVLGSLVLHAIVLFVVPQQRVGAGSLVVKTGESLVVQLRPRASPQTEQSSSVTISESGPQSQVKNRYTPAAAPIVAVSKSRIKDLPKVPSSTAPPVPQSVATETPTDMQAYVNAARARRRAASGSPEESTSYEREPSEDEIRMARVKRNLSSGTNGVFQILHMESSTAAFSFRGWTTDASNSRREYIPVELGANVDIEIAIVRKMIELIRRYFKGNFNWESQRLDRVVILSARLEDNEGLERFLMQEFFGTRSGVIRVR